MSQTTLCCGKCGSTALRKTGSRKGQPKYQCTACRHQALFVSATVGTAVQYAQVATLLLKRAPQRAIVRLTGVSRPTIVKPAKKSGGHAPTAAQTQSAAHTRTR